MDIVYKFSHFVLFPSRLRIKCLYLEIREKTLTSGLRQVIFRWFEIFNGGIKVHKNTWRTLEDRIGNVHRIRSKSWNNQSLRRYSTKLIYTIHTIE